SAWSRPTATFNTGLIFRSKKRGVFSQALLCALPMNFVPMMATLHVALTFDVSIALLQAGYDFTQAADALGDRLVLAVLPIGMQAVRFHREEALVAGVLQQLSDLLVVHQPVPDRYGAEEIPFARIQAADRPQVLYVRGVDAVGQQ